MPGEIVEEMRQAGVEVVEPTLLRQSISHVDIVYSTCIQEERFGTQAEADLIAVATAQPEHLYPPNCEPNTVIMHPLPRTPVTERGSWMTT